MLAAVTVVAGELGDVKTAEKLVSKAVGQAAQVEGLIVCGKFKSAYLAAVKARDRSLVTRVLHGAQRAGPAGASVAQLCTKFLSAATPT